MPEAVAVTEVAQTQAPQRFELPADEPAVTTTADTTPAAPEVKAEETQEVKTEETKVEGEKPDQTEPDPEKRRESRRIERKIGNAYRKAAEAQARADLLEQQIRELTSRQQVQQPAAQATAGAPRIEDFPTVEDYAKAVAKHESDRAIQQFQQQQAQQAGKAAQAKTLQAWEANVDKAADKYEDFNEVVGDLKPGSPWTDALMRSENGADVAYHLGQHIKEAERIIAMDPVSQILEIGRLSAKLAGTPPTPKQASKAPPPIKPVTGLSSAEEGPNESQDMAAWIKARNKQLGR